MTLTNLPTSLARKHRDIDSRRDYFGTMRRDSLLQHEVVELLGIRDNVVSKPWHPEIKQPGKAHRQRLRTKKGVWVQLVRQGVDRVVDKRPAGDDAGRKTRQSAFEIMRVNNIS